MRGEHNLWLYPKLRESSKPTDMLNMLGCRRCPWEWRHWQRSRAL